MSRQRLFALRPFRRLTAFIAFPILVMVALVSRGTRRRRSPRVVFGLTPIINVKYWAGALRARGLNSESFVYGWYSINRAEDFDHVMPENKTIERYFNFLRSLFRYDVLVLDFDGGFLRGTPLRFLDLPLARLAGQQIVAIAYGGDAIDITRCQHKPTQEALLADYPDLPFFAADVRRRAAHYGRWATTIVCGGNMPDYMPRCDVLVPSSLAIDTEEWTPEPPRTGDRRVRILHAPNHRRVKGTEYLERAVGKLRSEGLPVDLVILEGVPNTEVRLAMAECDIVASAFVMGYYELFAVEGMSMGKPVLNYWRPDLLALYTEKSWAGDCPIVDASPETLADRIRELAVDPDLRSRLGEQGRVYVEKHHSYDAVGRFFAEILAGSCAAAD